MGVRMDQWIGVNKFATNYIYEHFSAEVRIIHEEYWEIEEDEQIKVIKKSHTQRSIPELRIVPYEEVSGTYDNIAGELCYYIKRNSVDIELDYAKEVIQDTVWSGGPMYFVKLVDRKGNDIPGSAWTEKEIGQYV